MTSHNTKATEHRLRPAVFPNVPDSKPLFIRCPNCARGVPFLPLVQKQLAQGGAGHQCPNCRRYIAVVVGSCCNTPFSLDDKEWDWLVEQQPLDCPNCSTPLYLTRRPEIALETSFREGPVFCCFSEDSGEAAFVEAAKSALSETGIERLALYHHTTHERLSLAAEHVELLQTCELRSSFALFNNSALEGTRPTPSPSSSSLLPNLVFQITTSMFSAIESLVQETNVAIRLSWRESLVSYKKLEEVPPEFAELSTLCAAFIQQPDFIYLKALRNLSMHRRVTTLATMATFTLPAFHSLRPSSIRPECILYLPDDPASKPREETFDYQREVKSTLQLLQDMTLGFKSDLYRLLARDLAGIREPQ